jgi:hypothetical protein
MTSGCHGDSMPAKFSPPVCSYTGEAGQNAETGPLQCFSELSLYREQWVGKDKMLKASFSKIIPFKGTIRKCFNTLAVHVEGSRHPLTCLFKTLFSCQCPFKGIVS